MSSSGAGTAQRQTTGVGQPSIAVAGVSKWFGDVVAVSDVSFEVAPGVTALLGPNGAGKSTLLRLLVGLTTPSQGTVLVLGTDPRGTPALYRRIGLVPQQEAVFEKLTALRFVTLAAELHGLGTPGAAAADALAGVDLDPGDRRPVATYSKGMRQRVKVAQALVHDPEVVVLDEPLEGLDPRQRLHLIERFRLLGAEGRCVLVSSHVLDEVERFGSRVLVMAQGRLAAVGDFREIRELMDDRPHRLRLRADRAAALAGALVASGAAVAVRLGPSVGPSGSGGSGVSGVSGQGGSGSGGSGQGGGVSGGSGGPGQPGAPVDQALQSGAPVDGAEPSGAPVDETEGTGREILVDTVDVTAFRATVARAAQQVGARLFEVVPLDDDLESVFRYLIDPTPAEHRR